MKKLYWSKVQEEIYYKGKVYKYTHDARMIYADNISTSIQEIEDFEDFAGLHNLRGVAEETGKITLWMDDLSDRTIKEKDFEKVIVTTYINPIPDSYSFSKVMNELNYKDFIDFVKDNEIVLGGGKWK